MKEKVVLIDGNSILNRAFYGIPMLTNSQGIHTNAVYGFLNILLKILDEEQPQYLTVAFDVKHPTFRHERYAEYKGTRKPMPEELREQLPIIKDVLKAMNVKIMERPGYEADDILGTIAKQCEKDGYVVSLVSGDRDLLQIATDTIKIRIPKTKKGGTEIEDYNTSDVVEKYGINPLQIIDLKGLMGDASDNIPGVPGIGEKTALKILDKFQSVENAIDNIDEVMPNKARESLREYASLAILSKELATIKLDCELDYNLNDAKINNMFNEASVQMFKQLEFKSLIARVNCSSEIKNDVKDKIIVVDNLADCDSLFNNKIAKHSGYVGVYVDDDAFNLVGICINTDNVYCIKSEGFITKEYLLEKVCSIFSGDNIVVVQNLKKHLKYIDKENIDYISDLVDCNRIFDTTIAAYLLNPLQDTYYYDDISKDYANLILPSESEVMGKPDKNKQIENYEEKIVEVCGYNAFVSFASYSNMLKELKDSNMYDLMYNVEMPLLCTLYDMEKRGIKANLDELKAYSGRLSKRIEELELLIYDLAGEKFNINSPKQLGIILFEKMSLPFAKKTKSGYSTSADVLEKLRSEHKIINYILEYRQLTKLKSTYADGLAGYIEEDGRIRSNFNQTITATGRISSTEPNLQNIPVRMELGREIRKVFIPEDGYMFVNADYSQIELRVLAHMSDDERLIAAYKTDEDIHRITASEVFHTPINEVTDLQRRNAKAVNFGIVYGISSFGLGQDLNITRKEAEKYIQKYFETYPQVKTFLDGLVLDAKEKGYITTMFNRRRPVPELTSTNFMQRSFGERIAMNSPIQGTAADIIKIAMVNVNEKLKESKLKSRLLLQIHDELLIETHKSEVEEVKKILHDEMFNAVKLNVPLEVDVNEGASWFDLK